MDSCSDASSFFNVPQLYKKVFEQVTDYAHQLFSEDCISEAVIQQFKDTWMKKLNKSFEEADQKMETEQELIGEGTLHTDKEAPIKIFSAVRPNAASDSSSSSDEPNVTNQSQLSSRDSNSDESLNSDDDILEEDVETENLILCQYESVKRRKDVWKMNLHSGFMNLNGKQHVFGSAFGEAKF